MKCLLSFVIFLLIVNYAVSATKRDIPKSYIETVKQYVDHFNVFDKRTFDQRYYHDRYYFGKGGPIFIYLEGTNVLHDTPLWSGILNEMASKHSGWMFFLEHRYYGQSHPTEDLSLDNLRYLTISQAVADVANLITHVRNEIPELKNSKVIVIGKGYGANLATWLKVKYPHLVYAVVSSSAPLKQVEEFPEYYELALNNIKSVSNLCAASIEDAMYDIDRQLTSDPSYLYQLFNFCDVDTIFPSYFRYRVLELLAYMGQRQSSKRILDECNKLLDTPVPPFFQVQTYFVKMSEEECVPTYRQYVMNLWNETLPSQGTSSRGERQRLYQFCSEVGMFHTTKNTVFGEEAIPREFYEKLCFNVFDTTMTPDVLSRAIKQNNQQYGGNTPVVDHVIFSNGLLDAFTLLGVTEQIGQNSPSNLIPGFSVDCDRIWSTDPEEVKEAKQFVRDTIEKWLQ